ncbi:MAG: hypothetical protein IJ332_05135 [Clostridia bacterium]|nr:hypothetical protein [Clostridia bacterium]
MGIILTDKRKAEMLEQIKTNKRFAQLWNDYVARVKTYTSNGKNEIAPCTTVPSGGITYGTWR